jgi:hypothetical protein
LQLLVRFLIVQHKTNEKGLFMKEFFRKVGIVSAFALAAAVSTTASATPFTITGASFTNIGGGYGGSGGLGNDNDNLLFVTFDASGFATQNFDLVNAGDTSGLFNFGTVTFKEQDISAAEAALGNLGVSATFTFSKPGVGTQTVTATGTAFFGPVNGGDATPTDFTIDWNPVFVSFGNTGQFKIDVTDLAFTTNNMQNATASVTLVKADVPEPGSLALAGLGLAAAGMVRRRKR